MRYPSGQGVPPGSSPSPLESLAGQTIVALHLASVSGDLWNVRELWEWSVHRVSSQHAEPDSNS